ncbi:PREDICTED: cytoskeleton-associated protein 2-like [Chrysochloris asiatica]|uniref:Cytoskeleton-associated protein 2-like n=1 Tax=Chrysochloris asiatica TaxID=185453 RepID=A0A9B0U5B8_CHRAS|nr:PREDICTED: cytoskeleton-associated protein 2-like [Chrysochloris asiatica]
MVGPGPSAAAIEERQRKLQEYLAAKGKLKCQNTKPYLKAINTCQNLASSKSTLRLKKDVPKHAALPVKTTRPISIKLQPRSTTITRTQKPNLDPPKLVGKRLTSGCVSSNLNCKPSSDSHQHFKTGSSTSRDPSRKPVGSLYRQELKTGKRQVTDQGKDKCLDFMDNSHTENESSDHFQKDIKKENLPQTLSDSEQKPDPEFCTLSKTKTNSHNPTKSRLAPEQALGKSLMNTAILKDSVNRQFVGKTQIRIIPVKSQLSRGADLMKPREKNPKTVPSHSVKTLSRTLASKKPGAKDQEKEVNRATYERPNKTKLLSNPVNEQNIKHTKPQTDTSLPQGRINNKYPNMKQDQKSVQPCFRTQKSCVLQNSKAKCQRPSLTVGTFHSVIPSTPSIRANGTNGDKCNSNLQQKAQTLDTKLKKALSQNHFLNKTAPKTQAGCPTINRRVVPNGTQTNPDTKKKATEDRRKQLEEWQKSKGKIYKRPPMELKSKRKLIEKMNVSFWKSIEKEEEEKKAQDELSNKINNTLTECLQLIEQGVFSNEVLTILSSIPEAEKFAKFWICKAKLLASKGTFDVIGLYEEAIRNGATPILELREVILNILQDPNRTTEAITTDTLLAEELIKKMECEKSCLSPTEKEQVTATPQVAKAGEPNHPGIKLQIAPIPKLVGMPEVQDMKLITPVRRSARIERAVSHYPEMLQDHDLVVASLDELLEVEETECFIFRRNEALPVTLGFQILDS